MADDGDWSLPSQSARVRTLLHLAEGMGVGGLVGLGVLAVAAFVTDIDTGAIVFRLSTLEIVLLLFLAFMLVRGLTIVKAARGISRNVPPEMADWTETRNVVWVGVVGVVVAGALLFVSISLWEWWDIVYLHNAELLMTGAALFGFLFEWYILYRAGMHPLGR